VIRCCSGKQMNKMYRDFNKLRHWQDSLMCSHRCPFC